MRRAEFFKSIGLLAIEPKDRRPVEGPRERRTVNRRREPCPGGRIPTTPIECEHGSDLCPTCDADIYEELRTDNARRKGRRRS